MVYLKGKDMPAYLIAAMFLVGSVLCTVEAVKLYHEATQPQELPALDATNRLVSEYLQKQAQGIFRLGCGLIVGALPFILYGMGG